MKPDRRLTLLQHLALLTALKLALLTLLWWAFVRGEQLSVNPDSAAHHLHGPVASSTTPPPTHGATP